jgi:hypothetical protein
MGNPITDNLKIGTIGELLVQTRLLEYNVQAAPPIQDSGNDLIAVKGEAFRGIQVKTSAAGRICNRPLPKHYHILAVVYLAANDERLLLDETSIYLIPRKVVDDNAGNAPKNLQPFRISSHLVGELFAE